MWINKNPQSYHRWLVIFFLFTLIEKHRQCIFVLREEKIREPLTWTYKNYFKNKKSLQQTHSKVILNEVFESFFLCNFFVTLQYRYDW